MANNTKLYNYKDEREGDSAKTFSERTGKLKEKRNISVNRLADLTSLDQSNFNKVLNLQARIHVRDVIACADYFNVSTDYLLGRTDVKEVAGKSESVQNPSVNNQLGKRDKTGSYTNEEIVDFIYFLLKAEKAKTTSTSVIEEVVYEYQGKDDDGEDWWYPRQNKAIDYQALYFPRFWNPDDEEDPEYVDYIEESAMNRGNIIPQMDKLNKMLELCNKYLPGYKNGEINEKEFERIVKQITIK